MLTLRTGRTLKLGHDLRLRVLKVITSPNWRWLSSTSSEMFRTPRLAPTGRKFDQKLSGWVLRVITSPDATQLNSTKLFCQVESLKWSHRPTWFNSTKQFCWVESRRAMWSRLKYFNFSGLIADGSRVPQQCYMYNSTLHKSNWLPMNACISVLMASSAMYLLIGRSRRKIDYRD